jgi:hypothetical protein
MKPSKPAQRISRIAAWLSYGSAILTLLAAGYRASTLGTDNPIFASLAATVVFLLCCGVVLQVMGTVSLPDLKIRPNNDAGDHHRP